MEGYKGLTKTVAAMQTISLTGNVIPRSWRHWIKRDSGKVHNTAIDVLAELIYWYRPIEVVDEKTGRVSEWRKKFKADKLQKSYQDLADSLGHTKRQSMAAVKWLEAKGYITTEFRHFSWGSNILYIEVNPEVIENVTFNLPKNPNDLNPRPKSKPEPDADPIPDQNSSADPSHIKTSDTHPPSNNQTSDGHTLESEIPHNRTSDHPTLERDTYTENTHRKHNREHLHKDAHAKKKSEESEDLNLDSDLANHKCWGEESDDGFRKNDAGVTPPLDSDSVSNSAERAEVIDPDEEAERGARAGAGASGEKSKLEILKEMLGQVTGEYLSSAFKTDCEYRELLPWLDKQKSPDPKFAMWVGKKWKFDDDKKPSNDELLLMAKKYLRNTLKSAVRLRSAVDEWEAYQNHLTALNEAANGQSEKLSDEVMDVIAGRSNGRHKRLDVFEPLPWEPGMPLELDKLEYVIPQGASEEFKKGMRADAELRNQAIEWDSLIENIRKSNDAGDRATAEIFLNNFRLHVYNTYQKAKGSKEPVNKYFDRRRVLRVFVSAWRKGYERSVPIELHDYCKERASKLASKV